MDTELRKMAAEALIQLQDELKDKERQLDISEKSKELAFALFKNGSIDAEDIETSIEKFASQTLEELNLIERALEFNKQRNTEFGKISSKIQVGDGLDPLTRYLLEGIDIDIL